MCSLTRQPIDPPSCQLWMD